MAINFAVLANEINTDPNAYGYAAHVASGSDGAIADILNLSRDGTNGGPAITVRRANIQSSEVLEAIDTRDFETTATNLQSAWFESVTQLPFMRLLNEDGTNTRVLRNLRDILQATDTQGSRARLNAIANRNGSRAEQLFGTGTIVTGNDVSFALRGTR